MNERDRSDCNDANESLMAFDLTGPEFEELERVYIDDPARGAKYLADRTHLDTKAARKLLHRVYR